MNIIIMVDDDDNDQNGIMTVVGESRPLEGVENVMAFYQTHLGDCTTGCAVEIQLDQHQLQQHQQRGQGDSFDHAARSVVDHMVRKHFLLRSRIIRSEEGRHGPEQNNDTDEHACACTTGSGNAADETDDDDDEDGWRHCSYRLEPLGSETEWPRLKIVNKKTKTKTATAAIQDDDDDDEHNEGNAQGTAENDTAPAADTVAVKLMLRELATPFPDGQAIVRFRLYSKDDENETETENENDESTERSMFNSYYLIITAHHAVFDGAAIAVLVKEFVTAVSSRLTFAAKISDQDDLSSNTPPRWGQTTTSFTKLFLKRNQEMPSDQHRHRQETGITNSADNNTNNNPLQEPVHDPTASSSSGAPPPPPLPPLPFKIPNHVFVLDNEVPPYSQNEVRLLCHNYQHNQVEAMITQCRTMGIKLTCALLSCFASALTPRINTDLYYNNNNNSINDINNDEQRRGNDYFGCGCAIDLRRYLEPHQRNFLGNLLGFPTLRIPFVSDHDKSSNKYIPRKDQLAKTAKEIHIDLHRRIQDRSALTFGASAPVAELQTICHKIKHDNYHGKEFCSGISNLGRLDLDSTKNDPPGDDVVKIVVRDYWFASQHAHVGHFAFLYVSTLPGKGMKIILQYSHPSVSDTTAQQLLKRITTAIAELLL